MVETLPYCGGPNNCGTLFDRMKNSVAVLLCAGLMAAAACSRSEPAAPPVATPTVTVNKPRAAIGSPLQITYKFDVAPGARLERDHLVFLHVIGPDGETLWQDDHHPAVPTSQWQPGQTVEYTRTIFVPNYPHIGDTTLRVGLYDPQNGERAVLDAPDAGQREYTVGTLNLLPQADNIFLIYKDGWHPAEVDSTNPLVEWQWTGKAATLSFRNPKNDATFYIESDARTDLFNPPQQVTISVGGQPIGTFAADSKTPALRTFPITAAQFGDADMVEMTIAVDRTFSATGDSRELGIRVFHAFVEPM